MPRRPRPHDRAEPTGGAGAGAALVTGASSGIGAAFARVLAARGFPLVLVGRNAAALEGLAAELPTAAEVVVADLATSAGLVDVEAALRTAEPPVRLLVNNAGVGTFAGLADLTADDLDATILVNVLAPTRLMSVALGVMPPGSGLISLSSTAVRGVEPEMAVYGASKCYLDALSRFVRRDAEARGIVLTTVRPGYTRTAFHQRAGEDASGVGADWWLEPDDVARAAMDAHDAGWDEVTVVAPDPRPRATRVVDRVRPRLRPLVALLRGGRPGPGQPRS